MFLIIGNPKPIPLDFVVNFGSKIKFLTSSGIPFPLSLITIFIFLSFVFPVLPDFSPPLSDEKKVEVVMIILILKLCNNN